LPRPPVSALVLVLSAGCLDKVDVLDPEVGDPLSDRCVNSDSDPDDEISFARDVLPIFRVQAGPIGCACHQPSDPNPIGLEQTGLNLSTYAGARAGGINSGASAIIAGAPCDSILWQKISPGPPFGARMPFNGPPFLDADTRRLIADWIAEGARDN
jgi:hypothetical protein